MAVERFGDLNELLQKLQGAAPTRQAMPRPWECLQCARIVDADADDNCPVCGRPLPPDDSASTDEIEEYQEQLEGWCVSFMPPARPIKKVIEMQGHRIDAPPHSWQSGQCPYWPGDYWRESVGWCACCPDGQLANLSAHSVTENADGSITVSPSILVSGGPEKPWHGFIENGIWREC